MYPVESVEVCYVNGCSSSASGGGDAASCARSIEQAARETGSVPIYVRMRVANPNRAVVHAGAFEVALAMHDNATRRGVLAVGKRAGEFRAVFDDDARRVLACTGAPFTLKRGDVDVDVECALNVAAPATSRVVSAYASGHISHAVARVSMPLRVLGQTVPADVVAAVPLVPPHADPAAALAVEQAGGSPEPAAASCPGTSDFAQLTQAPTLWVCGVSPLLASEPGAAVGVEVQLEVHWPVALSALVETVEVQVGGAGGQVAFAGTVAGLALQPGLNAAAVTATATANGLATAAALWAGGGPDALEVRVRARVEVLGLQLDVAPDPVALPLGAPSAGSGTGAGVLAALALASGECLCVGGCAAPAALEREAARLQVAKGAEPGTEGAGFWARALETVAVWMQPRQEGVQS